MTASLNEQIVALYRRRAKNYDFTANLYYLFGYREWAYRRQAVEALQLRPGDTVVEIACGTGLNFALYQEKVGPEGYIIGVDLTDAMLAQAQDRIAAEGWKNVTLVHADARDYAIPAGADAVIATYALSLIPECGKLIGKFAEEMKPGSRLALLELQVQANWPKWVTRIGLALVKPFAIEEAWLKRKPWERIKQAVAVHLDDLSLQAMYFGSTYLVSGQRTN